MKYAGAAVVLILNLMASAAAQTPQAKLLLSVLDSSGGVLPGAAVTIVGLDSATNVRQIPPAKTSPNGSVVIDGLAPGRYVIRASFDGFDTGELKDVRLKAGDNKHVLVLPVKRVESAVTVAEDARAAAAAVRGSAFGTVLTREQINALSDDPAEMAQQLQDMAGGNAVIKVDSFTGAPLPPKALIKSIHVIRDTFSAENHSAENDEIDIITQPGAGPWEGSAYNRLRDGSLSGRSPFVPVKGPERSQTYSAHLGGAVVPQRASIALSGTRTTAFDSPNVNASTQGGLIAETLDLRRPSNTWSTYDLFDYALTRDQVLRMAFDTESQKRDNLGVGGYDLQDRAYSTRSTDREFRAQQSGPLGRRSFLNTRLEVTWTDSSSQSAKEAMTIRVIDAATTGGAQVSGGRHARDFEFGADLDHVRGKHSIRAGTQLNGGHYRSDDASNYLGTFTFTSEAALALGQPATFTQRIGDPLIEYWNLRGAFYLQDDIRVQKYLTLSVGARYEAQTHVQDFNNLDPRAGITWAPFKNGKTTVRASAGIFHTWLNAGQYEQTLRVDGFHQQELTIVNPGFPVPGVGGTVAGTNRYLLGDAIVLPRTTRVSAGVDQTVSPMLRVSVLYSRTRAIDLFRGDNRNAPILGVRPDPAFANVIATVTDARQSTDQIQTSATINLAPKASTKQRFNWRRTNIRATYYWATQHNNSDGAFNPPPSGTLDTEWGPSAGDRRHRLSLSVTSTALRNLNATVSLAANSGTPYTITTGTDDNGDTIFNDRPAGISRGSLRASGQWTMSANLSYGVMLAERNGHEYKLSLTASAENFTNHANFAGYSGVMTSPFFQQATSVSSVRRVTFGANLSF